MIRSSLLFFAVIGAGLVFFALSSDHLLASGWGMQLVKDFGVAILGLLLLYLANRFFTHVRTHEIVEKHGKASNQHVAFAIAILISCAYIIGSALQSAV